MEQTIKFPQFISFMNSPAGRGLRILAGAAMVFGGLKAQSKTGDRIALLGLLPISAGAFDICLLGPLFGGSFLGDQMRRSLHQAQGFPQIGHQSASFLRA